MTRCWMLQGSYVPWYVIISDRLPWLDMGELDASLFALGHEASAHKFWAVVHD
ncbi:MAG: hypothetical protein ABI945_09505 [Nitrospirales bacterium]